MSALVPALCPPAGSRAQPVLVGLELALPKAAGLLETTWLLFWGRGMDRIISHNLFFAPSPLNVQTLHGRCNMNKKLNLNWFPVASFRRGWALIFKVRKGVDGA